MGRDRATAATGKLRDELKDALAGEEDTALHINKDFAKRFQHNKERDELQRLKHRVGDEDDESDSDASSEDEDGVHLASMDVEFAEALEKIKKKDPTLYKAETQLFPEGEEDEEDAEEAAARRKASKKAKPVYLKDVLARDLLEDGPEGVAEDSELPRKKMEPSYHEEQEELRKAFLGATNSGGEEDSDAEEGGFIKRKTRTEVEQRRDEKEDAEIRESVLNKQREKDAHKVLSNFFGKVEEMNSNEAFLRDYILNQGWLDKDERAVEVEGAEGNGLGGDDEEELDEQDAFEAKYNFRFEEPGSERIVPHPRMQEHSIRKEETKRKRERSNKKEREAAEKQQKREELMRLKALKRAELDKKLLLIQEVAGKADLRVAALDMDSDFDAAAHDRRMAELFDDEYYAEGAGDDDAAAPPEFGDLEEELAALIKTDKGGFQSATAKLQRKKQKKGEVTKAGLISISDDEEDEEDGEEEEEEEAGRQRIGKRAAKRMRKEVEQHIEEYYKLDYEDLVGGVPCRFKYKTVLPKKFGLKTEQMLGMTDKELQQVVSLKHLAPYRDDTRDRKWFAPTTEAANAAAAKSELKKKEKRAESNAKEALSKEDAAGARLMSYEVPKVGKHKSITALSKESKDKLKVKKKKAKPTRDY